MLLLTTSGHNYDLHSEYKPSSDKGKAYLDWTAAAAEEGHNSDLGGDDEDIHDILHKHSLELHVDNNNFNSNSSDIDDILSLSPTAGTPASLSVASTSSPYSQLRRESSLATSEDGYEDDDDEDKECKENEID